MPAPKSTAGSDGRLEAERWPIDGRLTANERPLGGDLAARRSPSRGKPAANWPAAGHHLATIWPPPRPPGTGSRSDRLRARHGSAFDEHRRDEHVPGVSHCREAFGDAVNRLGEHRIIHRGRIADEESPEASLQILKALFVL